MKRFISRDIWSVVPLLFLLPACFFSQGPPTATPEASSVPAANGSVVMEDVTSLSPQAAIAAQFVPATQTQSVKYEHHVIRIHDVVFSLFRNLTSFTSNQPQCSVGSEPSNAELRSSSSAGLLDAGNLTYGAALQTTMLPVNEDSEYNYFQELSPGFPAGPYQIAVVGSADVNAFTDLLVMPEELISVSFNGVSNLDHNLVTISKAQGLTVEWTPALPNDLNEIFVEVRSPVSDQQEMVLQCGSIEGNFTPLTPNTPSQWVLSAAFLENLPVSNQSEVRLIRINDHEGTNPGPTQGVDFQGIRRYSVEATITN